MDGREAAPFAGIIDSQSVKTAESGSPQGFDAGKKVKSRKRHIATDTGGLPVATRVHAADTADIQDRDGAPGVPASIRHAFPCLRHVFADGADAGPRLEAERSGSVAGPRISSSARRAHKGSMFYRVDGLSNAPWLG